MWEDDPVEQRRWRQKRANKQAKLQKEKLEGASYEWAQVDPEKERQSENWEDVIC